MTSSLIVKASHNILWVYIIDKLRRKKVKDTRNELPELLQILRPAGEGKLALSLVFDRHFRVSFKLNKKSFRLARSVWQRLIQVCGDWSHWLASPNSESFRAAASDQRQDQLVQQTTRISSGYPRTVQCWRDGTKSRATPSRSRQRVLNQVLIWRSALNCHPKADMPDRTHRVRTNWLVFIQCFKKGVLIFFLQFRIWISDALRRLLSSSWFCSKDFRFQSEFTD